MASFVTFAVIRGTDPQKQPRLHQGETPTGGNMTKRGKVLRDTSAGPGLISIDGQHHQFSLEGVWRSDAPPVPGMAVAVVFAKGRSIAAVTAVSESQISHEQALAGGQEARATG